MPSTIERGFGWKADPLIGKLITEFAGGVVPRGVANDDWREILAHWAGNRAHVIFEDKGLNPSKVRQDVEKFNASISPHPLKWWNCHGQGCRSPLCHRLIADLPIVPELEGKEVQFMRQWPRQSWRDRWNHPSATTIDEVNPQCSAVRPGKYWCARKDIVKMFWEVPYKSLMDTSD